MVKIKLPFFRKKEKIETIKLKDVEKYLEELKSTDRVSEYFERLRETYEVFINALYKTKEALEILNEKGEKRFTSLARPELERINEVKDFNVSTLQNFYLNASNAIDNIVKIPGPIQRDVLNYENGEEAINLLNSTLKKFNNFKKFLAKRYSEYGVVNDIENAFKKFRKTKGLEERLNILEGEVTLLKNKIKRGENFLKEKSESLEVAKSKIPKEEVRKLSEDLDSLNEQIDTVTSYIVTNLLKARHPIIKILHSRNKKIFEFFKNKFVNSPFENINEDFWKMVNLLKKEKMGGFESSKREKLKDFLSFVESDLEIKLKKLDELKKRKNSLVEKINRINSKNRIFLKKFEEEKSVANEKLKDLYKKLKKMEDDKAKIKNEFKKEVRILEKILSRISGTILHITG